MLAPGAQELSEVTATSPKPARYLQWGRCSGNPLQGGGRRTRVPRGSNIRAPAPATSLQTPQIPRLGRPGAQGSGDSGRRGVGNARGWGENGPRSLTATDFSEPREHPCSCPYRWSRPRALPLSAWSHQALSGTLPGPGDIPGQAMLWGHK